MYRPCIGRTRVNRKSKIGNQERGLSLALFFRGVMAVFTWIYLYLVGLLGFARVIPVRCQRGGAAPKQNRHGFRMEVARK